MMTLPKTISDFLNNLNKANHKYIREVPRGFGDEIYKRISLDEKLNMFKLSSGRNADGGYDGFSEFQSYYINQETFLRSSNINR